MAAGQTTTATPDAPSSTSAAVAALPPSSATTPSAPSGTTTAATVPKKFPQPTPGGVGGGPYQQPGGVGGPYQPGGVGEPYQPGGGGHGEPYLPAAEVASALPVPTPDELPSGASLGFGSNGGLGFGGPGDECCGGPGGYGWFGGPGGFGPGTYGYSGPLYWGAAPAAAGSFGRVTNVLLPLVVAYVSSCVFA